MEKKTKHRILGAVVIVGLVVLAVPFFQGKKELTPQQILTQAPPFPDQPTQVSPANDRIESIGNQKTVTTAENNAAQNSEMPDDVVHVVRPSIINNPIPVANPLAKNQGSEIDSSITNKNSLENNPITSKPSAHSLLTDAASTTGNAHAKIKLAHNKPSRQNIKTTQKIKTKLEANGLAKLKGPAWVIQLGSFKNKANAMRLVNQLRAKGYKAFIQQVSTAVGGSTRVFVGPETKHTEARNTARQLENDLHIHGIVISYKPLTL